MRPRCPPPADRVNNNERAIHLFRRPQSGITGLRPFHRQRSLGGVMKVWSPDLDRVRFADTAEQHFQQSVFRCGDVSRPPEIVVAIPVCNESARLNRCIDAIAKTLGGCSGAGVVLLVNNSTDTSTKTALNALSARGMTGIVVDVMLLPHMATAGWARRLALDFAECWARPDAVLMTTDADGRVAPDWADANLRLLADGAHLVCGRIVPDDAEAALLPATTARSYALERTYTALSIELDALIDPRPHDPWPHHGLASGASLAVRARDYRAVGRMPPLACSEDRAFAALVEKHDLYVRHSDVPLVTVSCRLRGRARGGMADAIAARIADPDSLADERLLPADMTARRAIVRSTLRAAWDARHDIERSMLRLGVCPAHIERARQARTFGALWAEVEAGASTFETTRMRPSDLARELPTLRRLVLSARYTL